MKRYFSYQILFTFILLAGIYGFTSHSLKNYEKKSIPSVSLLANSKSDIKSVSEDPPKVYMTKKITSEGLVSIYNALGCTAKGRVAVKLHTGEPGGNNYLSPDLIKELVQSVKGTIVECNTAYGGSRSATTMHRQVAIDHGFTAIANVDIMDADGYISIPVKGGTHLTEDFVGSHFTNYDFFIILSHFKGHQMGGFGGAVKNMSIGIASSRGKSWIHSSGTATSGFGGDHNNFLESMAEAASAVAAKMGDNIIYINVMNNLSVDCDCNSHPATPTMANIGILASLDPVALDQACVDLVYAAPDGHDLIQRMESLNGIHTLEHAAKIGFGSRTYNLVDIDKSTSVNNIKTQTINIYPNPSYSVINIPEYQKYDMISILNIDGRIILKCNSKAEINIHKLNKGRYFIQFFVDGKMNGTASFIKM